MKILKTITSLTIISLLFVITLSECAGPGYNNDVFTKRLQDRIVSIKYYEVSCLNGEGKKKVEKTGVLVITMFGANRPFKFI